MSSQSHVDPTLVIVINLVRKLLVNISDEYYENNLFITMYGFIMSCKK